MQIGVSPLSDTSGIKRLTEKIKILEEELAELKAKPNERILVLEKELAEMTRLYDEKIIRIEEFEKEVEDRR